MSATEPDKSRALTAVASASGEVDAAKLRHGRALTSRNAAMLQAQRAGASYYELGQATGLAKVAVYKALDSAKNTRGQ